MKLTYGGSYETEAEAENAVAHFMYGGIIQEQEGRWHTWYLGNPAPSNSIPEIADCD